MNRYDLYRALKCASTFMKSDRPHAGLHFDRHDDHLRISATDGHGLIRVTVPGAAPSVAYTEKGWQLQISACDDVLATLKPRAAMRGNTVEFELDDGRLKIRTGEVSIDRQVTPTEIPFDKVTPSRGDGIGAPVIGIDPLLIARIATGLKALGWKSPHIGRWQFSEELGPIRFDAEIEGFGIVAAIMPGRLD